MTPGVIGTIVIADHPVLYLLVGMVGATMLLLGYVITMPAGRDQPFRRVYALLCLLLDRGNERDPHSAATRTQRPTPPADVDDAPCPLPHGSTDNQATTGNREQE